MTTKYRVIEPHPALAKRARYLSNQLRTAKSPEIKALWRAYLTTVHYSHEYQRVVERPEDWNAKDLAEYCDEAFEDYEIGQPLKIDCGCPHRILQGGLDGMYCQNCGNLVISSADYPEVSQKARDLAKAHKKIFEGSGYV